MVNLERAWIFRYRGKQRALKLQDRAEGWMQLPDAIRALPFRPDPEGADRPRIPHPELLREDGFLGLKFENSHHVMGGSRMAEDPANGVVTPELRLHGVRNAFVCSASVFPTSGFSNPTHTLIALAIRLADHLAAQLGGPHA